MPWLQFLRERIPAMSFVVLSAGIAASGNYIGGKNFDFLATLLSFIGILLFFVLMRIMQELQDVEKDRIAYPDRPLPRGLLSKAEVERVIDILVMIQFAYSLVLWVVLNEVAALAYLLVTIYLWLMYRDFGIGNWLARSPFMHSLVRQLVILPLAYFAILAAHPEAIVQPIMPVSFAILLFGAFFTYEICTKLNPRAHPVLATHIHYYGFRRTFEVALVMVALSAMGAYALDTAALLFPCQIVVVGAIGTLFFQPALYYIPDVVAFISLLLHTWAVALFHFF